MSLKLFHACLLPFAACALIVLAGWVREANLELPAGILAVLSAMPFIAMKG